MSSSQHIPAVDGWHDGEEDDAVWCCYHRQWTILQLLLTLSIVCNMFFILSPLIYNTTLVAIPVTNCIDIGIFSLSPGE